MRDNSSRVTMKRPRTVTFSTLEIIELSYCLGDNPSVNGGAPVSTSWECQNRTIMDLGVFEAYRPARRNKGALHLNKTARRNLLLDNGHSEREIQLATIEAAKTRKERMDTIQEIKRAFKALMESGRLSEAKDFYHKRSPSPVPTTTTTTANRSPGLTPSPIISRKSPMRVMASGQPSTTRIAHLRFPSSPERGFMSPRCNIQRKRSAPIDLGNGIFSTDPFLSDPYNCTPARICSPKQEAHSSPRSFLSSMRMPEGQRVPSPMVDKRPPIQPRRLASPPPVVLYQPFAPPRAL